MDATEMWHAFCADDHKLADMPHEAWAFGCEPDLLAQLVLRGQKTATTSSYPLYALENEPLPQVGEYNIILDGNAKAVCITQTTKVYRTLFKDVSARHAYLEGEGDQSLAYWRKVHQDFFTAELAEVKLTFTPDLEVVCEEFEVVFR
ncbi:MAG: ASCH domain-containing protein [Ligilactobacillus sp.]|nr:ASCH domain-containing protein [Ligilactobacillus sp.]